MNKFCDGAVALSLDLVLKVVSVWLAGSKSIKRITCLNYLLIGYSQILYPVFCRCNFQWALMFKRFWFLSNCRCLLHSTTYWLLKLVLMFCPCSKAAWMGVLIFNSFVMCCGVMFEMQVVFLCLPQFFVRTQKHEVDLGVGMLWCASVQLACNC